MKQVNLLMLGLLSTLFVVSAIGENTVAFNRSSTFDLHYTENELLFRRSRNIYDSVETWKACTDKGLELYKAWKDKTGPDADTLKLEENMTYKQQVQPVHANVLAQLPISGGITTHEDWHATLAEGKPPNKRAHFSNFIAFNQGMIFAADNDRGADDDTLPVPWFYSETIWWVWRKVAASVHPDWDCNPEQADYSNLKIFWRLQIRNPKTITIMDSIGINFRGNAQKYAPDDPDHPNLDNPFWALLGCPNGRGIIILLTEHKEAMRNKAVQSIGAYISTGEVGYRAIWANIG